MASDKALPIQRIGMTRRSTPKSDATPAGRRAAVCDVRKAADDVWGLPTPLLKGLVAG